MTVAYCIDRAAGYLDSYLRYPRPGYWNLAELWMGRAARLIAAEAGGSVPSSGP